MQYSYRNPLPNQLVGILAFLAVLLSCGFDNVLGQTSRARFNISSAAPDEIRIQAELPQTIQSWSFRNAYAGILGLADRVEQFQARGALGEDVPVRKIVAGEFRSDKGVSKFQYTIRLQSRQPLNSAHLTWLNDDHGFLMLADLLPEFLGAESIKKNGVLAAFNLPRDWKIYSSINPDEKNIYSVKDPERAVFFVGRSLRKASKSIEGLDFEFVLSGSWPFKDAGVVKAATRVVQKYFELTGFRLPGKTVVMLAPFPVSASSTKWKAETRGSSLILLMDPQARIENWTAQLGVILTHEILHLWVPNSLALQGDYDWFFEGFTLYVALVTALELRLIDFQEYLDTLARVYDSYLSYADNLSLIDAAERRWTSSAPAVYDKGMLVAFLYDLIVRRESNARSNLQDRYRLLFGSHATAPGDGNEVIISLLGSSPATRDFPKSYIESRNVLELEKTLPVYGLLLDSSGASSRLRVNNELTREQQQVLHSLGYRH